MSADAESSKASPETPAASPTAWAVVGLLGLAMVIAYCDRVNLSIALPLVSEEFSWTKTEQGRALSAFFWIYTLLQIPAGIAADRFGVRRVYLAGFVLWCLATAGAALTTTLGFLIAIRLLLGVGQSIVTPAGMRYIRFHFAERQRGAAIGLMMAGTKFGPAVGFPIAGFLTTQLGWRGMFGAMGAVALVWLIPWLLWVRKDDPAAIPRGQPDPSPGEGTVETLSARALLASPVMWGTLLGTFCYMYFVYYCMTWMPTYFKEQYGMSIKEQSWYSGVAFGGMAAVIVAAGWAADRLIDRGFDPVHVRKAFTIAGLILASTQTIAAYSDSVEVMLFFSVFSLCGLGLMTPNYWALTQTLLPGGRIALVVGMQNMAANLAGVVSPWVTGWMIERTGNFDAPIRGAGLWLALGIASYLFLVRRKYAPAARRVSEAP